MPDWRQRLRLRIQEYSLFCAIFLMLLWPVTYLAKYYVSSTGAGGTSILMIGLESGCLQVRSYDAVRGMPQLSPDAWEAQSVLGLSFLAGNRFSLMSVPMPFLAAMPLLVWVWIRRHPPRRRRVANGFCSQCGYDLRGSTNLCPECGLEFNSSALTAIAPPPRPILEKKPKASEQPEAAQPKP